MTESEKLAEWVRYYAASPLKMNALQAVLKNDPKILERVMDKVGLVSRLDVVNACRNDWNRGE